MERGVRQGDPLSPFLFIIAMEGLNAVMRSACSSNVFTGIKIPRSDTYISHLFYADDALFIGDWSISNIKNLARILRCFHIASGLKVNFTKSRIFGIGVDPTIVERWTAPLGCKHATLPFIYLGVPIGANMRLKKNWKPVVDRFREKLSKWKAKTLSFGGRLTLIKAVLGSLPTYYFSLFLAPNCVLDLLEKIRRNFLWGGSDEKRKISWISWDRIVDEKENGGLGVGSLKAFNRALLTKWWWRYRTDTPLLWVQVIQGIHNLHRKPANCLAKKSITGTWHSIASLETDLENYGVNLDDIFHKQVKDGNNTFFWWDKWIGDAPLKCLFPELYKLEKKKGCKVSDRLSISGPVWNWISKPINGVHDIELSNITTLLLTHSYASGADVWMCPLSPDGSFYVHKVRSLLDSASAPPPWDPVVDWLHVIPIKILCCVWKANLGRLPSACELMKRGIQIDSLQCSQCINGLDEIKHTFFDCPFASRVWAMIFEWCNIAAPQFLSIGDMVTFSKAWGSRMKKRKEITSICYGTCWWIWKFRCDRRFNVTTLSSARLVDCVKTSTFNWMKYRDGCKNLSWCDWTMKPL